MPATAVAVEVDNAGDTSHLRRVHPNRTAEWEVPPAEAEALMVEWVR